MPATHPAGYTQPTQQLLSSVWPPANASGWLSSFRVTFCYEAATPGAVAEPTAPEPTPWTQSRRNMAGLNGKDGPSR